MIPEPYDCSDDALVFLACQEDASWPRLGMSIFWSFVVYIFFRVAILPMSAKRWNANAIPSWAAHYVGTVTSPPADIRFDALLRFLQLVCSTLVVFLWIRKSYLLGSLGSFYATELLCCFVFILHMAFTVVKNGFSPAYASGFEFGLDCFTITPLLLQRGPPLFGGTWLTVSYLRVFRVQSAFARFKDSGVLEPFMGDIGLAAIAKVFECISVIFTIAGTVWVVEGLGDIPGFFDATISSGMGDISFFQMCYFSFITISTVGYGDFSPRTVPGRFFIVFATVAGVSFFSVVSMQFVELQRIESSGRGKYRPSKLRGGNGHILIFGGGVDSGSASIVENFLQALCRDEDTPDIVLLGQNPATAEVRSVIKKLNNKLFYVKFFQGTPMSVDDLERVRVDLCSFAFVLCDFNSINPLIEDESNILRTAALARYRGSLNYRLMLVESSELDLGFQVGLDPFSCFALSELKASLLAGALRAPGLATLILNLCLPNIPPPDPYGNPVSPWLPEYIASADLEFYGFQPHTRYRGLTFTQAATKIAADHNVIVIAAQFDGVVRVNPRAAMIDDKTILFALSSDDEVVDVCAYNDEADKVTWAPLFNQNRKDRRKKYNLSQDLANVGNTQWLHKSIFMHDKNVGKTVGAAAFKWKRFARSQSGFAAGGDGATLKPGSYGPLPSIGMLTTRRAQPPPKRTLQERYHGLRAGNIDSGALERVVEKGGHTVLCVLGTSEDSMRLWQQIEVIVAIVRRTHDTPIVVVAPASSNFKAISVLLHLSPDDESLLLLEGDPKRMTTMVAAGVETCEQFLTLAPTAPPNTSSSVGVPAPVDETMMDRENLLACAVLEQHLTHWNRTDLGPLYDWFHPHAVKLMPPPPTAHSSETAFALQTTAAAQKKVSAVAPEPTPPVLLDGLPNLTPGDVELMQKEPRCHYRFAGGRVLPKPALASLFSMAFYTPGVLELLEALINPAKTDQSSLIWVAPVPKAFEGRPYRELAREFTANGAIPIGLLRGDRGPIPYVCAMLPCSDLAVGAVDAIYFLADLAWAEKNVSALFADAVHRGGPGASKAGEEPPCVVEEVSI